MKKLKTILQSNIFLLMLVIITIIITIIRVLTPPKIYYTTKDKKVTGKIEKIEKTDDKITLIIKGKEKIQGTYYFTRKKENNKKLKIGDTVKIIGTITPPKTKTTKNIFDYAAYLKKRKIYHVIAIKEIKIINRSNKIIDKVKNILNEKIKHPYMQAFLLGNNKRIKEKAKKSYQENGISHLLAISGMQFYLIANIILSLLKKLKISLKTSYLITFLIIILYFFILDLTVSILRGVLFFILFSVNKIWKLKLSKTKIIIFTIVIILLINPYFITEAAFWYSLTISIGLLYFFKQSTSYWKSLCISCTLSFLLSIPISLYYFYQINILSIIYNLFYIPYVNIIVFPLTILTFLIPVIEPLYQLSITILEQTSIYLSNIEIGKLIFPKVNIIIYIIEFLFIIIYLKKKQKKLLVMIITIFLGHYLSFYLTPYLIEVIDVGQGDSMLLFLKGKTVLIDTGGKVNFNSKNSEVITNYTTIPLLKSLGIKRLNFLLLTHGDYDHMGEAINLVNNFKVEKVILNCGEFNDLEKELIKVLDKKNIKYYSCIKELDIKKNKLYFLQTKEYNDENDNSNVIYTELDGYKFMFMGDASHVTEKEILNKYNIPDIDVLKVGHHGSKTSSSKEFINEINPKYSIISVGKNNRYDHPNKEVLDYLKESKIYRTDQDGSIMFKIKNNKLKIETCSP